MFPSIRVMHHSAVVILQLLPYLMYRTPFSISSILTKYVLLYFMINHHLNNSSNTEDVPESTVKPTRAIIS